MSPYANPVDVVPKPFAVGGIALRPFCLGHHLLFKACGLPFAGNSQADCGLDDILIGATICGLTYEEGLEALSYGTLPQLIKRWRRRTIASRWPFPRHEPIDIESAFRNYLLDGYAQPPIWKRSGGTISLSAPWELLLKLKLLEYGLSETEILNGYLPARRYDYYTAIEWDQVKECDNPKLWRSVFFTYSDCENVSPEKLSNG